MSTPETNPDPREMLAAMVHAWGAPVGTGRLRRQPEDFQVEEVLGFAADGEGGHWLLKVEKTGLNTEDVARHLARIAGVPRRDVGYSGMKDRHAVTWQWFSVPATPNEVQWRPGLLRPGMVLQEIHRHRRKLRKGTHKANRFEIRLREVQADPVELEKRLCRIRQWGYPNYFMEQRFGRNFSNLSRARQAALGQHRTRGRHERGLLLSAARGWLFNQALSRRLGAGDWLTPQPGDLVNLAGSRSLFQAGVDEPDLELRLQQGDIHLTGPLWGRLKGEAAACWGRESQSLCAEDVPLVEWLKQEGVDADRRPSRVLAEGLQWQFKGELLVLRFTLAPGAYATALLRELIDYNAS